ncbi:RING finger protein 17-like isoform X1 [Dinothrombium tinctorium]|uniref:RING finger protein 17-like isoform X1 n=1 Tax=Dinothrombium tinctorium TaxID=1965070 RepID=A0A3S3Q835_9ACAR|nr:RING finger protein 17-like isoform X1 [Dinothrombium tinctorium]
MEAKLYYCSKNDCVHSEQKAKKSKAQTKEDREFVPLYLLACAHSVCELCLIKTVQRNDTFMRCDRCLFNTDIEQDVIKNVNERRALNGHDLSFNSKNATIDNLSSAANDLFPIDSYVFGEAFNAGLIEAKKTVETIDIDVENEIETESNVEASRPMSGFELEDDQFLTSIPERIRNKANPEFLKAVDFAVKAVVELRQSAKNIRDERIKVDNQAAKMKEEAKENFHFLHSLLQIREKEVENEIVDRCNKRKIELDKIELELIQQRKQLKSLILKSTHIFAGEDRKRFEAELLDAASQSVIFEVESIPESETTLEFEDTLRRSLRHYAKFPKSNFNYSQMYTLLPLKKSNTQTVPIKQPDLQNNSFEIDEPEEVKKIESNENENTELKRIKEEIVTVTSIINPEHFYVVLASGDEKAEIMQTEIDNWCGSMFRHPPGLGAINPGDYCFAFSTIYGKWCRGVFEGYYASDDRRPLPSRNAGRNIAMHSAIKMFLATINLIDYGSKQDILYHDIRERKEELFDFKLYPKLGIKCSLHNIKPTSSHWEKSSIDKFNRFVLNRKMYMYVKEIINDVHYVDLSHYDIKDISSGQSSLIEILVFSGVAKFKLGESNVHLLTSKPMKTYPPPNLIDVGQNVSVLVVDIESPDLFHVNLASSQSKAVALLKQLQVYNSPEIPEDLYRIYVPIVNLPCVAKFFDQRRKTVDYYRALITEVHSSDEVTVQYVDFGNKKRLKTSDLRLIKDEFLTLERQAIPCKLIDVKPAYAFKWSTNAIENFKDLVHSAVPHAGQILSMNVYDYDDSGKACVVLHRFDGQSTSINLNAALVKEGFAQSTGELSSVGERRHIDTINIDDTPDIGSFDRLGRISAYGILREMNDRNNAGKTSKKESLIKVIISYAKSPDEFWIQLAASEVLYYFKSFEQNLDTEMNVEQKYHSRILNLSSASLEVDEMCVYKVLIGVEVHWRRAVVREVLPDPDDRDPRARMYKIFLLDYGETVTCKRRDIRKLPKNSQFMKNGNFSIPCRLTSLKPSGGQTWTATALEKFQQLLEMHKNDLYILIKEKLPEEESTTVAVALIAKETVIPGPLDPKKTTYHSIKNILIREGVAMPLSRRQKGNTSESDDEEDLNTTNLALFSASCSKQAMPFSLTDKTSVLSQLKQAHRRTEDKTVPTNLKYLEPEFPADSEFKAVVTEVDQDLNIHFRIVTTDGSPQPISIINQTITQALRERECLTPFTGHYEVGRACTAYFDFDQTWNRAEIQGVVRDETTNCGVLTVRFVDYGNVDQLFTEKLSSDVFNIEIPKLGLYGQLHNCKLFDESLRGKLMSEMNAILVDKTLKFRWEVSL